MKISVVKHWGEWVIRVVQGCQRFHLNPYSTGGQSREEVRYMAAMFRKALKSHDKELKEKLSGS